MADTNGVEGGQEMMRIGKRCKRTRRRSAALACLHRMRCQSASSHAHCCHSERRAPGRPRTRRLRQQLGVEDK